MQNINLLALVSAMATALFADAFVPPSPSASTTRVIPSPSRFTFAKFALQGKLPADGNEDEENEEQLFFDDFEDFVAGSASADEPDPPSSSSFMQSLTERIEQTRTEEVKKDARLAKNWKTGNWGVRGFILDKSDPVRQAVADTTSASSAQNAGETAAPRLGGSNSADGSNKPEQPVQQDVAPIHVSAIVPDQSHFHDDASDDAPLDVIAVGRTDGTVLIVKLGTEYLTKFTAVPKLRVDDSSAWDSNNDDDDESVDKADDSAKEGGPIVRVETELVRTEELKKEVDKLDLTSDIEEEGEEQSAAQNNMQYPMEDPFDELYGGGSGGNQGSKPQEEVQDPGTPFEVLHQFRAHDQDISVLLFDDRTLYTAGGDSGEIRSWTIPDDDNNEGEASVAAKIIPGKTLSDAHSDRIVTLKTLSSTKDIDTPDLLLSASRDGSFALWDIESGDLVTRCQMLDDSSEPVSIGCTDIDTSGADSNAIYFGLSSGHVVGYYVSDIIGSASVGGVCPIPSCRFQAHESIEGIGGVMSILAAGEGTSAKQQARRTSILLTGGADGTVKQWEMMSRKLPQEKEESDLSSPSFKLEHWPRLANQRMKRRAHMFKGHSEAVNTLAQVDQSKFLSASADGTVRVWSPSEGKEMYKLDGFTASLNSLVLAKETLITDGMNEMVCVHDFNVDIDEAEGGYELEW